VLVCVAGAAMLALVAWLLFASSVLGLRDITVTGSQIAGPDTVRAAAGVAQGTPLLSLDTGRVAARIRAALPSVRDVQVRRQLPHTLVITVTERSAVAVVPEQGGFAVLADDGVVFQHLPALPTGTVVVQLAAPGPHDAATLAALRVVKALTAQLRAALGAVVAPDATHISLTLADGRTVVWGDADSSDVKATVATALLDRAAHTINVSVPDFATVS
jgi:cell division protein FtsQ